MNNADHISLVVSRANRIPMPDVPFTTATTRSVNLARSLDIDLMALGVKLAPETLETFTVLPEAEIVALGEIVLAAVRKDVGDHVHHNPLFRTFPRATGSYARWMEALQYWVRTSGKPGMTMLINGETTDLVSWVLNYGKVLHTYEDMLAVQQPLAPMLSRVFRVLSLGSSLKDEIDRLYLQLGGTTVPLSDGDMEILRKIAPMCVRTPLPEKIPVREVKAVLNLIRVQGGESVVADTVTDVLRLAVAHAGGDLSLEKPCKFKKIPRPMRRRMMEGLNAVVDGSPEKLADVLRHVERWKRLGEAIHPNEYPGFPLGQKVFAVARGDEPMQSFAGKVEDAFLRRDLIAVLNLYRTAPGTFFRALDRVILALEQEDEKAQYSLFFTVVQETLPRVSGRVILGVREHLVNRTQPNVTGKRFFPTKSGKAWVCEEHRPKINRGLVDELVEVLDAEIYRRLPVMKNLVVSPEVRGIALPLTEKNKSDGMGTLPRGSMTALQGDVVRFFMYWREKERRTDYDLSALLLRRDFSFHSHCSYTQLYGHSRDEVYAVHSGDITSAPDGASEFIDVRLNKLPKDAFYVIPQVNIYGGESFTDIAEAFFGFMERTLAEMGKPFEPTTVRMRSDLRGKGRVALPLVIQRQQDGTWAMKWVNLYAEGKQEFNRVEGNKASTALLATTIANRQYLSVGFLTDMLLRKAEQDVNAGGTYVGLQAPTDGTPSDTLYTPQNFIDLIPA